MTKQESILTVVSVVIFLVLLAPTLSYKLRKERDLPTGEPAPVTRGRRFIALLSDAVWVFLLTLVGLGLFAVATLIYGSRDVSQKPAIEHAIHPVGTVLLLGISAGYVVVSLLGRHGVSLGTCSRKLAWVDANGRPAGRGHTVIIGLAFIVATLGTTAVGAFASIGGAVLFIEAVSILVTERGIIGKLMHLHLVDARTLSAHVH
ncbi:hypothetical protein FYJ43_10005 [Cutibacterium sp. WCA-380-WT-3A]|uniref:RDD family protein n=1 Tax=Cutibacterium porci TaxID=2605781 RepID=A0A7K0J8S4_9ACTN|nr:RDD family protein [Cutibacterium porci]MSS46345.1 hypothetical protein [Cutibacterium porci]